MSIVFLRGGRRILNDEDDDNDGVLQLYKKARQTKDPSRRADSSLRSDSIVRDTDTMSRPEPTSVTHRRASPQRRLRLTKSVGNHSPVSVFTNSTHLVHDKTALATPGVEQVPAAKSAGNPQPAKPPPEFTTNDSRRPGTIKDSINGSAPIGNPGDVAVDLPHRVQTRSNSVHGSATPPSRNPRARESSARARKSPSRESSIPVKDLNDSKDTAFGTTLVSHQKIRDILTEKLRSYHEGHLKLLKWSLKRERARIKAHETEAMQTKISNASPFSNMPSVDEKLTRGTKKLVHTTFNGCNTITEHIDQPVLSGNSNVIAPPPYTSYISLDKSVLVENERRLPSWPVFAGYEDAGEEYDHDVTKAYSQGIPDFWEYHTPQVHKAESLGHCVEAVFKELGCTFTDALRCLLDRPKNWWSGLGTSEKATLKDWRKWTPAWGKGRLDKAEIARTKSAWRSILNNLPKSDAQQLATAGLLCAAVADICKVNVWDIAIHHQKYINSMKEVKTQEVGQSLIATELCRICLSHRCICHGEFLDESDSDSGLSPSEVLNSSRLRKLDMKARINVKQNVQVNLDKFDTLSSSDMFYNQDGEGPTRGSAYLGLREHQFLPSGEFNRRFEIEENGSIPQQRTCSHACFWKVSNRQIPFEIWTPSEEARLRQNVPAYASNSRGPCLLAAVLAKPCIEVFQHMIALSSTLPRKAPQRGGDYGPLNDIPFEQDLKERSVHYPCSHDGPCNSNNCPCYENKVECEKSCHCDSSCRRRFPGCNCKRLGKICHGNPDCQCFANHRECDIDLCSSCGADEVLDPANRNQKEAEFFKSRCRNIGIQRGVVKRTYVGNSTIEEAGYGLFMGEPTKKGDYIGPYSGFILSKTEADRLGVIYHEQARVYLFVANTDLEVDALLAGSKIRYINHSGNSRTINCQAFLYLCNGSIKIALYALKDIAIGEELFFDYGYTKEQTQRFVEKSVLEGSSTDDEAIKAFGNVAVRPDRAAARGGGDDADTTPKSVGETAATAAMLSLDEWPLPTKSDSEDEDYQENGESGRQHGQRSARKRPRSSSPGSSNMDGRRKRARAR